MITAQPVPILVHFNNGADGTNLQIYNLSSVLNTEETIFVKQKESINPLWIQKWGILYDWTRSDHTSPAQYTGVWLPSIKTCYDSSDDMSVTTIRGMNTTYSFRSGGNWKNQTIQKWGNRRKCKNCQTHIQQHGNMQSWCFVLRWYLLSWRDILAEIWVDL